MLSSHRVCCPPLHITLEESTNRCFKSEDPLDGYYASLLGNDEQDQCQPDDDGPLFWYFVTLLQEETAVYCQPTPMHHPFPPAFPVAGPSNHTALIHMTPSQNTLPQGQFHGGSHSAHPHATPSTQESDDVDGETTTTMQRSLNHTKRTGFLP